MTVYLPLQENRWILGLFFLCLLAILIAFIVGVAWGYQGGLQAKMKAPLRATLVKYKVSWTALVK